jgi:hypothetical protein
MKSTNIMAPGFIWQAEVPGYLLFYQFNSTPMNDMIFSTIGYLGALFYLAAYLLLNSGKWTSASFIYQMFNIMGGTCLVANTLYDHSYPSFLTNFAWIVIAFYGLSRQKKNEREAKIP